MTATHKGKPPSASIEALWGQNGDLVKRLLKEPLQEALEAEMTECPVYWRALCWRVAFKAVRA